jgi:hypothetical protein
MSDLIERAKALRDIAWAEVVETQQYKNFAALKAAVDAMSKTELAAHLRSVPAAPLSRRMAAAAVADSLSRKVSQADAGVAALREAGEPLPIGRFMEAAIAKGAAINGANPLANFRSTVSKDARFRSVMRNGMYFWWFSNEPLPPGW